MLKGLPPEWIEIPAEGRLTEDGFSIRFGEHALGELVRLADYHGYSIAAIVRILVNRGLAESRTRAA